MRLELMLHLSLWRLLAAQRRASAVRGKRCLGVEHWSLVYRRLRCSDLLARLSRRDLAELLNRVWLPGDCAALVL